jgi:hypothetical protein
MPLMLLSHSDVAADFSLFFLLIISPMAGKRKHFEGMTSEMVN